MATYRAATACGTILAVSANSNTSFEDLAIAAPGHLWVQLYPFRDKAMSKEWLERAKAARYEAVVVTLDSQWPPKRERNIRNKYQRSRGVNYPKSDSPTPRPAAFSTASRCSRGKPYRGASVAHQGGPSLHA